MKVSFNGIFQAHISNLEDLPEIAPKGMIYLDQKDLHITLFTLKELAPFNGIFKREWKEHEFPPFPDISFEKTPYVVTGKEGKSSFVIDLDAWSQVRVWSWLYDVLFSMGLEDKIQPSKRVFHVSLANLTGSKYDSVPDPWNWRVR